MVLSTTIIAAAGYFINDYYDIKTDLVNKPDKIKHFSQLSSYCKWLMISSILSMVFI